MKEHMHADITLIVNNQQKSDNHPFFSVFSLHNKWWQSTTAFVFGTITSLNIGVLEGSTEESLNTQTVLERSHSIHNHLLSEQVEKENIILEAVQAYEATIDYYQKQLTNTLEALRQKEDQTFLLETQLREKDRQLHITEVSLNNLHTSNEELNHSLIGVQTQLSRLDSHYRELDDIRLQLEEELEQKTSVMQHKESKLQAANDLIQQLQEDVNGLHTEIERFNNDLTTSVTNESSAKQHITLLENALATRAIELAADHLSREKAHEVLAGQLAEAQFAEQQLTLDIERLNAQVNDYQMTIADLNKQNDLERLAAAELVQTLYEENRDLNHALAITSTHHIQATEHISSLETAKVERDEELLALHDTYSQEMEKMQLQIAEDQADVINLIPHLAHLQSQRDILAQEIEQLRSSMQSNHTVLGSQSTQIEQLTAQSLDHQLKANEFEHALYLVTSIAEKQETALNEATTALLDVSNYNALLQMENEHLRVRLAELERANRTIKIGAAIPVSTKAANEPIKPVATTTPKPTSLPSKPHLLPISNP